MQFWPTCWNFHAKSRKCFAHNLELTCGTIGFSIGNIFLKYNIRASRMHFWHSWRNVFAKFPSLFNTLYVSGQLVSHKLFSRARRTQFWQTKNYTSKIQKHTKLKKTRKTCFSWKRISRHFTCNFENFVHILAHIKSHSDEQAQVDSPKREGIFICNLLSGNDFPQNVFVNR